MRRGAMATPHSESSRPRPAAMSRAAVGIAREAGYDGGMSDQPKRRFQFRLRTLMIVVTYTAITAGILTGLGTPIVERSGGSTILVEENWPSIVALTAEAIAILFTFARAIAQ